MTGQPAGILRALSPKIGGASHWSVSRRSLDGSRSQTRMVATSTVPRHLRDTLSRLGRCWLAADVLDLRPGEHSFTARGAPHQEQPGTAAPWRCPRACPRTLWRRAPVRSGTSTTRVTWRNSCDASRVSSAAWRKLSSVNEPSAAGRASLAASKIGVSAGQALRRIRDSNS